MAKIIGIYKITSPSGKIYIGQSNNVFYRFSVYKKVRFTKCQTRLYRSFVKNGVENHIFEIIEECEESFLNERERYWQDFYNVTGNMGLNCRLTTTKDKSGFLSKETRLKISLSQKGKIIPEWQREIIRKSATGRVKSEETKAKFRASLKGRKYPKEYGIKISAALLSAEIGKEVFQYDKKNNFLRRYFNVCQAVRDNRYSNNSNIYSVANGLRKTAYGFIWKWELTSSN